MEIGAVNCLSCEDFVSIFGNVVESCPMISAAVWSQRPYSSVAALEAAIDDVIEALPESGIEGVLRRLPDLGGERLRSGALSPESLEEQRHAGLDRLDASEASRVARLNAAYRARFGFPFVLCARENDQASVVERLRERLRNTRAQERARAVEEVKKIARLRLRGLVLPEREQ